MTNAGVFCTKLSNNISLSGHNSLKEIKVANYRYITVTSCPGNNSNFDAKVKGIEREEKECWDIDTPFDLEVARLLSK